MTRSPLRGLAMRILRGPDAECVLLDLDELYARDRARGLSVPNAVVRHLRRTFDSAMCLRRAAREPRAEGQGWFGEIRRGTMLQDLRFGLRLIRKHPAPVGIAIGGLALAIGVVVSVFTIVDATMLKPFGMDDPASVVTVGWARDRGFPYWSYSMFLKMQEQAKLSRVEAAVENNVRFNPTPAGDHETTRQVLFASGGYLQMLGGRPSLGRSLEPADDRPGAPAVAVLSDRFWQSQLAGDAGVVGKTIWLNGSAATVVGVMQPAFTGPVEVRPSIWMPLAAFDEVLGGQPLVPGSTTTVEVIARIAPHATQAAAQEELSAIVERSGSPDAPASRRSVWLLSAASPGAGLNAAETRITILCLVGIVGLVLAVACANTANLLLAAATTRAPEIGVRLALGAGTRRIARQLVNESLLLGFIAAGGGFVLAIWFVPVLSAVLRLSPELSPTPDLRALLFAMAVAVVCGVGAGLSPARHGARGQVLQALKTGAHPGGAAAPSRLRSSFVAFQSAVSIFLLVVAAILVRMAVTVARIDVGFDIDRTVTVDFDMPRKAFDQRAYLGAAIESLRAVPAIERTSITQYAPFGYSMERDRFMSAGKLYQLNVNRTDNAFFAATGLRILRGRGFTDEEVAHELPVALVSANVARTFYGTVDPIGQSLSSLPQEGGRPRASATIIGVVNDGMLTAFYGEALGAIYRPLPQAPANPPSLIVRTSSPVRTTRAIEDALRGIDPRVRARVALPREGLEAFLGGKRTLAALALPTAFVALLLAALGTFGVTAFVVSQRAQEMSLRMALGAARFDILTLLLKDSLRPVLIGLVAGLALALAFSRVSRSELSGIGPYDPVAVGLAVATMAIAALGAVILPARRAMQAEPASLLRHA